MAEKNQKKDNGFLIQGSILAIASVLVRLIGIVYRIPLTNILDDGGNAAYSTAYAIYSLIWMVASFGIPTAVSKMVAERLGNEQGYNVKRIFFVALCFALVVGGIAFSALFFGSGFIANTLYSRPEIKYALMVLAPTVWVSTFLGVFRGFFQGHGTMIPTAISQIFEQIVNAIMSIVGAMVLAGIGYKMDLLHSTKTWRDAFGAAGGTVGTLSGAAAGLLICIGMFKKSFSDKSRYEMPEGGKAESYQTLLKTLVLMILPITLNSAIYNISGVLDSFTFSKYAALKGLSDEVFKISWNAYEGKYHLLTHVPLAFATALSASAVPNLSRNLKTSAPSQISAKIRSAIRFAMIIAIPSCVGLAVLAAPILQLLFSSTPQSNEVAAKLLLFGGITVILYSFSTITNGVLQGIGRVSEPAKNAAISLLAHMVILVAALLVFPVGIYAVVLSDIIFGLMMNVMNYRSIYNAIRFKPEIKKSFLLPGISSLIMGAAAYACYKAVMLVLHRNSIAVLIAIMAAVMVYAMSLLITGAVDEEDIVTFPKGRTLLKLAKKTHLLRKPKSSKKAEKKIAVPTVEGEKTEISEESIDQTTQDEKLSEDVLDQTTVEVKNLEDVQDQIPEEAKNSEDVQDQTPEEAKNPENVQDQTPEEAKNPKDIPDQTTENVKDFKDIVEQPAKEEKNSEEELDLTSQSEGIQEEEVSDSETPSEESATEKTSSKREAGKAKKGKKKSLLRILEKIMFE